MLSEIDKLEYKKGVYEAYLLLGAPVKYFEVEINNSDDLYGENENNYTNEPIELMADIQPFDPTPDSLDTIPTMGLNLFNFDIPVYSLEQNNLDAYKMLQGQFEFNNKKYAILDVTPQGLFTDFFTSYKFKARML